MTCSSDEMVKLTYFYYFTKSMFPKLLKLINLV